ncbi:broad-complex core protein isoforms 1/2/3/4/5 isoform X2 [Contarinia nasturtii]|uniref:broad-complex core protein isoforms 1/2/3/4/5 isoform X2 n=1 Tax=Contarinia nasturtii TaxID=265458 RepID=UPI0012D3DC5D|nr:broad-complex core protein isoforms 1/2/3/4/5 isoform X2 [Contarinia nasturtii]
MSSSQIAENYQLKWHSHLTNLNSSVATLFRNDKFADVLLFTSQMDGGCGIPAHKIILSSCSHFFAQVFDSNPSPPNSMVYIVLPPEISRRSIQILIQYMYSGEATVSNDILNEVLHGGELLKIRGLCRNKQTQSTTTTTTTAATAAAPATAPSSSMNETSSLHYSSGGDTGCDKSMYELHTDRTVNNAIIKESPVIVTSPQHMGSSASVAHKPSSSSTSSAIPSGSSLCQSDPDIPKRSSMSYGLKSTVVRNHCAYNSPTTPLHIKSSSVHNELGHMPPPIASQITSSTTSSSSLIHSPDSHSNSSSVSTNPNNNPNMGIKKESMTINAMNDDLVSVPAHYGLVSLQIAAAVKKAQQISEKRCANSTSHLYQKSSSHHANPIANNHESQSTVIGIGVGSSGVEMHGKHIENGNNSTATITTTSTNNNFVRRYSDDYFAKDDIPSGSHLHHQQAQQQTTQMPEDLQMMAIKQEPVEWSDFDHENASLNKSSIEVAVKPELIYSKGDTDEEAEWCRHVQNQHIESHSETTHCVPKKRKHIESSTISENIAALRCDLCDMYFATPAEWVRHVQNHTETELALSNNNASLRQSNTATSAVSHRSSRGQPQHIETSKYGHSQSNSHR